MNIFLKITSVRHCSRPTGLTTTPTQPFSASNDILRAMDDGKVGILVLLDLSAAFDIVDHSLLIQRLQNEVGLTGTALYHGSGPMSRTDVSASSSRARCLQNSSCVLACHKDQSQGPNSSLCV